MAYSSKTFGKLTMPSLVLVVICLFGSAALGQPWDGGGVEGDPYQIWTAADMQAIGGSAYLGAHFKLMADIDLSAYTGTSFNIIGNSGNTFTGVFDGNGHTISNFTYTTNSPYIGLFGYVYGDGAEVKDLGLIDPNVNAGRLYYYAGSLVGMLQHGDVTNCYAQGGSVAGGDAVGGLVGVRGGVGGTITNCYATASVSGDDYVGGLVGLGGEGGGPITNCYATGSVSGDDCVGGLVGKNESAVINCYSTGSVSGNTDVGGLVGENYMKGTISNCYSTGSVSGDDYVGGLVGWNDYDDYLQRYGTIINCYSAGSVTGTTNVGGLIGGGTKAVASYWDINTSGQPTSAGGIGLPTAQMQTLSTFIGWGGCGNEGVWTLDEGNDYPRLWWENQPGQIISAQLSDFVAGAGTEDEPYLIYTAEQLNLIGLFACEFDKHFKLMADIDLSGYTGTSFNIIGIYVYGDPGNKPFTGVFDGNGHTISNFSYSSTGRNGIGLFGFISGENAEVRDLGLVNPDIDAGTGNYVGSLVGRTSNGTISGCYIEGGSVSGTSRVGGLVGQNGSYISDCYAGASVTGNDRVGGLVGTNGGTITNCYSTGSVSGIGDVGGLVGGLGGLMVYSSFWDIQTSGQPSSAGGAGLTTVLMQMAILYTSFGWDFVDETINGTEDIWRLCVDGTSYPQLNWQFPLGDFVCPDGVDESDLGVLCGEWLFELIPADVWPGGGDGIVNFLDLAIFADGWQTTHDIFDLAEFADQWLKTGLNYLIADIAHPADGDGIVNMLDFAALAKNWLAGLSN